MTDVRDLLPGEVVLWQGRPDWRAMARDVLHVRLVVLYFALFMLRDMWLDRGDGLSVMATLEEMLPQLTLMILAVLVCGALAWACARTTRYTLTSERCVLEYGLALNATLSLPLRRVASVSVAIHGDGTGDIPLSLKPGRRVAFLKLWPHARPWRFAQPVPMLRGVRDAARVGDLLSRATAAVVPGQLGPVTERAVAVRAAGLSAATGAIAPG